MSEKNRKPEKRSLLTRLFTKKKSHIGKQPKYKSKPLTPRQRSIAEIKQMAEIGKKDPERLAKVLSGMLRKNRNDSMLGRSKLDSHVSDIVKRDKKKPARSTPKD
tara:strand:+ start:2396 stop:2710 length:315 start_codon:yes stop_codon:yes gene_type:complete